MCCVIAHQPPMQRQRIRARSPRTPFGRARSAKSPAVASDVAEAAGAERGAFLSCQWMFQRFFTELRAARVPVSLKEYLLLVEALEKEAIDINVQDFYYLSRAALVKDE